MSDLTPRQTQILRLIQDAIVENGMPPRFANATFQSGMVACGVVGARSRKTKSPATMMLDPMRSLAVRCRRFGNLPRADLLATRAQDRRRHLLQPDDGSDLFGKRKSGKGEAPSRFAREKLRHLAIQFVHNFHFSSR